MPSIHSVIAGLLALMVIVGLSVIIVGYVFIRDFNLANIGWIIFGVCVVILFLIRRHVKD